MANAAGWLGFYPFGLRRALYETVGRFDLVHVTEARGPHVRWAFAAARATGGRVVWSPLGALADGVGIRKPYRRMYDVIHDTARLITEARVLIAQSPHEAGVFKTFGAPASRISTIGLGVDGRSFRDLPARGQFRRALGIEPGHPMVLFVGRLHPTKGLDVLLKASALVRHTYPHLQVVLIGWDHGALRTVRRVTRALGLEDVVRILPPAFEADRIQAYVDADVFAVAATTYEETSLAAMEAVASGTPCVLTRQCEIPGLEAAGGGLVTDCDPESFAAGLRAVLSDRDRAARALSARRGILASQTAEHKADAYADLFRDIVGTDMPNQGVRAARLPPLVPHTGSSFIETGMPRTRPRVVYWDNLPAPYGVERYNTLAERSNLDFSVWFLRRIDSDRSWDVDESTWRFNGIYVEDPSESLEAARRFVRRCDEVRPDLVLSLYGERSFVIGHSILKGLGIRTAFVVLPTFDAWVRRAWWKEMAKAVLFRSADAAKVPGPDGRQYARRYGFATERIACVTRSIDVDHYAATTSPERRNRLRARLGLDGCVFLYVGRFWNGKGLPVLLEAFRHAKSVNRAMSLLLVGDGPDEEALRNAAAHIEGVTFHPFVQARSVPPYYEAADVFVFPTLGDPHGQVIEEAHAAGLPIITSDAVGDVRRRVTDGTTGFVVPAADPAQLAQRMLDLAADADLRKSMGARGAERAKRWSHDVWAADFERFVGAALALPRRVTSAGLAIATAGSLLVSTVTLAGRARTFIHKARRETLDAIRDTTVARVKRLAMWVASLPWRASRPKTRLQKFGTMHGGWILPVDLLTPPGACYCIGVGDDSSLEDELLRRSDCDVWSFDPTPPAVDHVARQAFDPTRFTFAAVGVWDRVETRRFFNHPDPSHRTHSPVNLWDTGSSFHAPCATVAALMREYRHDALVLLKLATEGAEWRVLQNILDDAPNVRILCVEFCQPAPVRRIAAMVRRLRGADYQYLCHTDWKFTFIRAARPTRRAPASSSTVIGPTLTSTSSR